MPGERIQRRIDSLLDQAEEASDREEWYLSARRAREALNLDAENEDARLVLSSPEGMLGVDPATAPSATPAEPKNPAAPLPTSFASGRHEVRGHLGDGATKRVFLAHDTMLDRDVAFALMRTVTDLDEEGLVAAIEEAVRAAVLGELSGPGELRYHFVHAFFQQTLYEELVAPRRRRLNRTLSASLSGTLYHRVRHAQRAHPATHRQRARPSRRSHRGW